MLDNDCFTLQMCADSALADSAITQAWKLSSTYTPKELKKEALKEQSKKIRL